MWCCGQLWTTAGSPRSGSPVRTRIHSYPTAGLGTTSGSDGALRVNVDLAGRTQRALRPSTGSWKGRGAGSVLDARPVGKVLGDPPPSSLSISRIGSGRSAASKLVHTSCFEEKFSRGRTGVVIGPVETVDFRCFPSSPCVSGCGWSGDNSRMNPRRLWTGFVVHSASTVHPHVAPQNPCSCTHCARIGG
jgi:hypothetical protein